MKKLLDVVNLVKVNTLRNRTVFIYKYPSKLILVILKFLQDAKLIRAFCLVDYYSLNNCKYKFLKIYLIINYSFLVLSNIVFLTTARRLYCSKLNYIEKLMNKKNYAFRYLVLISTHRGFMTGWQAIKLRLGGVLLLTIE